MSFSFKPLWRQLIDKDMKKENLKKGIGISSSTLAKMSKDEFIAMKILNDICIFLDCKIENIIEYVPDKKDM